MSATRLTQRRVESLRPRRRVRDVRDTQLKGFGVRVMPSGAKRYFVHSQNEGRRVGKIVGDAVAMAEADARVGARAMLAAHRDAGRIGRVRSACRKLRRAWASASAATANKGFG